MVQQSNVDTATSPRMPDLIGESGRFNIRQVLFSVLKRPWIPVLIILLINIPAAYYFLNSVRLYRSQAQVMLPVRENTYSIQNFISGGSEPTKPAHYYTALLSSDNFLRGVHERMREMFPDENIGSIKGQVKFETSQREAGIFVLYSLTPKEHFAVPFVQAAMDEFSSRISSLEQQEARAVLEFINLQIEDLNESTVHAEKELQDFLQQNKFVIEDPELGVAQMLNELENNLAEAETNLRLIDLDIESTEQQINSLLEGNPDDAAEIRRERRSELEDRQQALTDRIEQLEQAGAPPSALDSLNTAKRRVSSELLRLMSSAPTRDSSLNTVPLGNLETILANLVVERKRALNRVNHYEARLAEFRAQHPDISEDILTYTQLQRRRDVLNQTMAILLEKKEETRIRLASQLGGMKVLEDPTTVQPLARNTIQKMLLVFIVSLLAGVVVVFIVDLTRSTIDAEPDITQNYTFPLLGVIPGATSHKDAERDQRLRDRAGLPADSKLLIDFSSRSMFTEAMRSIRTSLLFHAAETKANVVAVTSPMPSEGKSLTSANMAILVQRSGKKTVLIDGDLRRPVQHRQFGLPRKPGLTDYLLSEDVTVEQIIKPTHEKNLFLIPAGGMSHDPAELVASRKMRDLVKKLQNEHGFDFVFIDTPPTLPAVDSRLFGEFVDGLIIVARAERTKVRTFHSAVDILSSLDINIIGSVLNYVDRKYNRLYYYTYNRYHSYYTYYYRPYTYYNQTYAPEIGQDGQDGEDGPSREEAAADAGKRSDSA